MTEYEILRSARRTISLEVRPDGRVLIRAPRAMPKKEIDAFAAKHADWLEGAKKRVEERSAFHDMTDRRRDELTAAARDYLPKRTAHWAEIMGVSPAGVRITDAKTRFGSCSPKNRICYSFRLMAYPPEAVDYVIVHELAHILQKNHSPRFYAEVQKILPDWRERKKLLER